MPLGVHEIHLMLFDVVTCATIVVTYAVVSVTRVLTTYPIYFLVDRHIHFLINGLLLFLVQTM
jgi:hypothetical protein